MLQFPELSSVGPPRTRAIISHRLLSEEVTADHAEIITTIHGDGDDGQTSKQQRAHFVLSLNLAKQAAFFLVRPFPTKRRLRS